MTRRAWLGLATAAFVACLAWLATKVAAMREDPHSVAASGYRAGGLARLLTVVVTDTGGAPARAVTSVPVWPAVAPAEPSVVLVTLRSARADRVPGPVTPNLAALAERAVRFDAAIVTLANPRPTWASWMTGLFPHRHGVLGEHVDVTPGGRSVAALLETSGWETRATTDGEASRFRGLGFGRVEQEGLPRDPHALASSAANAIRQARAPFFHAVSFDVAAPPHATRAPFYRLARGPYRGRFKYAGPAETEAPPVLAEDTAHVSDLYDAALGAADDALAPVIDAAAARGAYLVVTAEHGQALFEAGRGETHGTAVDGDDANHVPLLVAGPGLAARRVAGVVRDVDLAPTLLALAGRAWSGGDGSSFAGALRGEVLDARIGYEEADPGPAASLEASRLTRQRAVRDERWKLVLTPTRGGEHLRLYDLVDDARATRDVARAEPAVLERLRPLLDAYRRSARRAPAWADVLWIASSALPAGVEGARFDQVWPASMDPDVAARATLAGALVAGPDADDDAPSLERDAEAAGMAAQTFASPRDAVAFVEAPHAQRRFAIARSAEPLDRLPARDDLVVVVTAPSPSRRPPEPGAALLVAPGRVPALATSRPVRDVDLAPTLTALLGLDPHPATSGSSLLPLLGGKELEARPIVVADRDARWLVWNGHRLRVTAHRADVFDAAGARTPARPELVAELRARLEAAEHGVPVAGSDAARHADEEGARIRLRFAGGGAARRVSGHIDAEGGFLRVEGSGLAREAFAVRGARIELAFVTPADATVGIDLVLRRRQRNVGWQLYLDDRPWPRDAIYGGAGGSPSPLLERGVVGRAARDAARGDDLAAVDPARELGLFVVRTPPAR